MLTKTNTTIISPSEARPPVATAPDPHTPSSQQRWLSIDALRGGAVFFMIAQHVTYWICSPSKSKPLMLLTWALGGMAAPIFFTLAGLGAAFMFHNRGASDRTMIIRGLMIIAYGYLLNALAPHWFNPESWFVLHMIGFAILTAPLLRRMPTHVLMALFWGVLVVTIILQTTLDSPFQLYNRDMASSTKPGGLLRSMAVESFFPVFPWLAFFIAGMISGRWLLEGRSRKILQFATALLVIVLVLVLCFYSGAGFPRSHALIRFFMFKPNFYPAMTPITLLLIGLALMSLYLAVALGRKVTFTSGHVLVCLGRASLTFVIVHVTVIRGGAIHFGFWHKLPGVTGGLMVLLILILFSLAAVLWRKVGFKFGFEWLLRVASK